MEKKELLEQLYAEGKGVYSISKLNCVADCQYEAYLTYVKRDRGTNGIYGIMGSKVHKKIEEIIQDKTTKNELLLALNEELTELSMLNIDFPKDNRGGDSIKNNWIADVKHFCLNFTRPKGEFTTEDFVLYKINENRYVQGYIDLIRHNKDGSISIFDWKTSTDFSKDDLLHHGRQLIFYALAKEQEGYKVREVAWIMVKYCEVKFIGKIRSNSRNKTQIVKVINRGKLLKELQSYIESDLAEMGYDEIDTELLLRNAIEKNSFETLPKEIKEKYTIKPYVRKYDLTDALRHETLNYINTMADLFESKSDDEKEWTPRKFTKMSKSGKEYDDTFKCNILCNHRNSCVHIKRYNASRLLLKAVDENLF